MRIPYRSTPSTNANVGGGGGDEDQTFGLCADTLIPGRGDPIKKATLIIHEGKIAWVGATKDLPSKYADVHMTEVPVLMPGLWDTHTHFMGANVAAGLQDSFAQLLPGREALIGAVTVDDLRATLMAGFTSVRELGGYAGDVFPAVQKGAIVGPNVYSAMSVLSITGGHGDQHEVPVGTLVEACKHGGPFALCDGPDECTKMVRLMVRRGAKVIKVCSTGGVLSLNDQPEDSQFSPEELRAIVSEAARSGRVVAAHAIGKNGIMAALEAGVKSIEHGMYLDEEVAALMKEKDAILCPTRHIVECLAEDASELAPENKEKLFRMLELSRSSLKLAIKEGVKIALGTDTYSSDRKNSCAHGTNAMELHWAVKAGMTPLQAIEMGTAIPPETLGPQAPKAGLLKDGYDADVVAMCKNPLDDIGVLTKPSNITHVWKGGKLFKSPPK